MSKELDAAIDSLQKFSSVFPEDVLAAWRFIRSYVRATQGEEHLAAHSRPISEFIAEQEKDPQRKAALDKARARRNQERGDR
jgi:hypothetical protein